MSTSKIQLLADQVISQIAAAEVVQRPATVVKELLENAIDAGSQEIKLIVKEGGKEFIQVIDDGEGMNSTDAERCFQHHATSKISSVDDLFNIRTLGFRGEALASIAAVTQVELITKRADDELAVKILMEGGKIKKKSFVNGKKGTQITIKNIFFNVPARRNFLKSTSVENRHIIEELQRAVLNHPEIAFSYWQNEQQIHMFKPTKLIHRIVHLFGDNYQKNLIPCQEQTDTIKLEGYIAAPSQSKKSRGGQYLFVNKRYVKNAFIYHAIKKAFEGLILPDAYPFYILNLTLPRESIDVHVHPMKTEIKFDNDKLIYTLVSATVKKALAVHHVIPSIDFRTNVNQDPLAFLNRPPIKPPSFTNEERSYTQFKRELHQPTLSSSEEKNPTEGSFLKIESEANYYNSTPLSPEEKIVPTQREKNLFNFQNSYIFASLKSGMLVINLKAAYERIFYERYRTYLDRKSHAVQKLLFPIETKVSPADYALIQDCRLSIEKLGFRLEMSPPDTITFTAQPPEMQHKDVQNLLDELIEEYKASYTIENNKEEEAWAKALAKRMASLQKKKVIEPDAIHALVDQLFACKNANYTPAGEKIWSLIPIDIFTSFLHNL